MGYFARTAISPSVQNVPTPSPTQAMRHEITPTPAPTQQATPSAAPSVSVTPSTTVKPNLNN